MTDPNSNVITTWNPQVKRRIYHTDICRAVGYIDNKRYITEAEARRRGYGKCAYCADEYETSGGDQSYYERLQELAAQRAADASEVDG